MGAPHLILLAHRPSKHCSSVLERVWAATASACGEPEARQGGVYANLFGLCRGLQIGLGWAGTGVGLDTSNIMETGPSPCSPEALTEQCTTHCRGFSLDSGGGGGGKSAERAVSSLPLLCSRQHSSWLHATPCPYPSLSCAGSNNNIVRQAGTAHGIIGGYTNCSASNSPSF